MTGANAGEVPGPDRAGAPVGPPEGDAACAVWADTIGGCKHNPASAGDTWNIELWYRKDL